MVSPFPQQRADKPERCFMICFRFAFALSDFYTFRVFSWHCLGWLFRSFDDASFSPLLHKCCVVLADPFVCFVAFFRLVIVGFFCCFLRHYRRAQSLEISAYISSYVCLEYYKKSVTNVEMAGLSGPYIAVLLEEEGERRRRRRGGRGRGGRERRSFSFSTRRMKSRRKGRRGEGGEMRKKWRRRKRRRKRWRSEASQDLWRVR